MFTIKICGVTTVDDARAAAAAGADAIGLNFYGESPRFLPLERAQHVAVVIPKGVVRVGLFVNAPAEAICGAFDALGLDLIQLHGDEPPEFLAELGKRPVMRAFRVGDDGLAPVVRYLDRCGELRMSPAMILLDAQQAGKYGGTGVTADWNALAEQRSLLGNLPLVLAGGLTADNVAEAIYRVRPDAVDTASGVETSAGQKDRDAMRRFVTAAREAFDNVSRDDQWDT
ncbi:MAG: phosphoribosylanthranilate isomerase [Pirellulales bacterium]